MGNSMIKLHKIIEGGVLSHYFNDKIGFREVERIFLNSDAVTVLEKGMLDEHPRFKRLLSKKIPLENIQISGNSTFIYPLHIQVEITDGCNLHCEYCYRNANANFRSSKFISWTKLRKALSKLKKAGMTELGITGGEATLHPDFADILAYATKNFEHVELISNGTNGTTLEKALLSIPVEHRKKLNLSISFNRWMREYEMFLKGKHYLNKTIQLMSKCLPVRILATDYTFDPEIWKTLRAALIKQGASVAEFNIAMPLGRGTAITDVLNCLETKKRAFISMKSNPNDQLGGGCNNCGLILRHTVIDPDGNARPCALFPVDGVASLGNLFDKGKSLFEKPAVCKYYYIPQPSDKTCKGCPSKKYCRGCVFHGLYENKKECAYKKIASQQVSLENQ